MSTQRTWRVLAKTNIYNQIKYVVGVTAAVAKPVAGGSGYDGFA